MTIDYKETFFIVPSYVLEIPGLTLGFLKVYETIFQFWNKNLPCFLSNGKLSERTNLKHTQISEALLFLEKNKLLLREQRGNKRFLIRPTAKIEWSEDEQAPAPAVPCSKNIQHTAPAGGGYRSSGTLPTAPAVPEYKEVEYKEINTTSSNNFFENYQQKEKENLFAKQDEIDRHQLTEKFRKESLSDELAISIYRKRFDGLNISLEQLYEECVDYWSQTNQQVYKARFITHLRKTPVEKYKDTAISKSGNYETEQERNQRYAKEREKQKQKLNGNKA